VAERSQNKSPTLSAALNFIFRTGQSFEARSTYRRFLSAEAVDFSRPLASKVERLDRASPSEGRGHTFESCRVRLSVDLDLVFPDYTLPREQALKRVGGAIRPSAARLRKQGFQTNAPAAANSSETKLLVRRGGIEVDIEVNFVSCKAPSIRFGWRR
jgi:hypothetical protein